MQIPAMYWPRVVSAIAQIVVHSDKGLCIRPKPNTVPIKFCVSKAIENSHCCARHQDDCPTR